VNGVNTRASAGLKADSRQYFQTLGARIAQIRKLHGYTQAELGKRIGTSQQAVFAYELGERRVSMLVVSRIANVFSMTIDDLGDFAAPPKLRKGKLSARSMRQAERIQRLPTSSHRFLIRILDLLEERELASRAK
jgi:transcriptional regulator with XRE-family HTH domain